ncbi:hypothetical protein C7S18_09900 [Ahniella affigens]|uniref:DUF1631 domain-containing protein n=1 Tax=Ahniella affigens TaxID=2021234 RepID=A0A2P1PRM9_9GAMM|nr:DUF1631 family protein [Ahniella affigens]AVP97488.1 hypothetical protein C7S18_09900 [Ahniella affigens]
MMANSQDPVNSGNIVPFSRTATETEGLRERCAVRVLEAIRETLDKLYSDALQAGDDALFDRAEKAFNSSQQADFFDTMRRLRLAKPDLAGRALSACKQEIELCFRVGRAASKAYAAKTSLDELALVDADTIESDIAITTAATRARSKFSREWQQLELRIDGIFSGQPETDTAGRRFGPEVIAEAFGKAVQQFECSIEIRLTLLKFMERELVQHSEALLQLTHQALTDCGVAQPAAYVPTFRPLRGPAGPATPGGLSANPGLTGAGAVGGIQPPGAMMPLSAQELDPALGRSMQEFLSGFSALPAGAVGGAMVGGAGAAYPEANIGDVLRALSSLDHKFKMLDQAMPVGGDVASALREQLTVGADGSATKLRPLDAGVIDLISLMFEYAINDKHLPPVLQASLARLQIPYLKLALIDPQFLAKREHPARRLLDELAQAAVGWTEQNDKGLRQHIDGIVHHLVDGFKDDTSVFEKQRALLAEFTKKDVARTEIAEKRAVQAADGKSKMEAAQRDAAAVMKQKLEGSLLPKALGSMVRERWSNYMVLTLLRHGQDSGAWSEAVRLLEFMARFPRGDAGLADRAEWRKELEQCEPIMRKGLAATGVHDADIDEVLNGLQELVYSSDRKPAAPVNVGDLAASAAMLGIATPTVAAPEPTPAILEPVIIDVPNAEPPPSTDSPLQTEIDEIHKLATGTWIEMQLSPDKRERVKLLWVSGDRRNYLFVNANGIKVADKKMLDLAEDLKANRITILDKKPLVERAFEAAMAKVRLFRAEAKKG